MAEITGRKKVLELIKKYNFHTKKKYGQNFLIDENILNKISEAAELTADDIILEVGPGLGVLTNLLADKAGRVKAVELDETVIPILKENISQHQNVEVIHGDILKVKVDELLDHFKAAGIYKVVANLPYYITTPIIANLLEAKFPFERIVIMVQKEVGERMSASPGGKDYGAFTLLIKYFCDASIYTLVSPGCFYPPPEVTSAVVVLKLLKQPRVNVKSEKMFFTLVKAAFQQRRKTLLNALKAHPAFKEKKDQLADAFVKTEIDPQRRGETLSIDEFARLSDCLS